MARAWIITEDRVSDGHPDQGVTGPRDADEDMLVNLKLGQGYAFTMKDDDGEIYYRGRAMRVANGDANPSAEISTVADTARTQPY